MLAGRGTSVGNLERAGPGTLNLVERQRPCRGDLLAVPGDLAARQLPAMSSRRFPLRGKRACQPDSGRIARNGPACRDSVKLSAQARRTCRLGTQVLMTAVRGSCRF